MDKILAGVGKVSRVRIVVAGAGCRVQVRRRHDRVLLAAAAAQACPDALGGRDVGVQVALAGYTRRTRAWC